MEGWGHNVDIIGIIPFSLHRFPASAWTCHFVQIIILAEMQHRSSLSQFPACVFVPLISAAWPSTSFPALWNVPRDCRRAELGGFGWDLMGFLTPPVPRRVCWVRPTGQRFCWIG